MSTAMSAQSAFVENAAKSIFTLTTFKPDGSILASSHGIFISNNGEAVADWKSFIGAKTAVVVDAEGRLYRCQLIKLIEYDFRLDIFLEFDLDADAVSVV